MIFDPEPESAAEASRADAEQRRRRAELTDIDIRMREIQGRADRREAAEGTDAEEEQALRRAAWDQRRLMLNHLRDSPLVSSIKEAWMKRLESPTSEELARLQADVSAFRTAGGPLRQVLLGKFLLSFEMDVDLLRGLCRRYEQTFS
jgi:hypothetical protein